ncbi:hypothetical protein OUZ56_001511 [Daphnia magna]|uniref:Uncharacterized protein n=1 Tax=Daphnia magna TaxID=35525 RepID=A0ABR0A3G3_9CRUS|nr:hypothetical protein OUZ56_001511 [Daphnia magna]
MGCATSQLPLGGGSQRQRRHSSSANSSPPNNVTTVLPDNHHHHNDEKANRSVALATNNVISQQTQQQQALRIVRNPSNTDNRPSLAVSVAEPFKIDIDEYFDGFVSYHDDATIVVLVCSHETLP